MDNINTVEIKKQAVNNIIVALSDKNMKVSGDRLDQIKDSLNILFENNRCRSVNISNNVDKLPFGIYINPVITSMDFKAILFGDKYTGSFLKYDVDIDGKLYNLGLSPEDITELLLHDVNAFCSPFLVEKVKNLIDIYALYNNDTVEITSSFEQQQLLVYAIKDTMYKLYSGLYGSYDETIGEPLDQELRDRISKIYYNNISIFDSFPKIIILQWAFMIYKNMKLYSGIARDTLQDAKDFTGSEILRREIDNVIASIGKVNLSIIEGTDFIDFIKNNTSLVNEVSIFKSLKTSGLRAIENDYYEYAILVKSASDENEAMYALRGINTRINILTDYVWNTNLSDSERKHWEQVIMMYQDLRNKLVKKNILNKKSYGLWFDYSKLDNLDKPQNNDNEYE